MDGAQRLEAPLGENVAQHCRQIGKGEMPFSRTFIPAPESVPSFTKH